MNVNAYQIYILKYASSIELYDEDFTMPPRFVGDLICTLKGGQYPYSQSQLCVNAIE